MKYKLYILLITLMISVLINMGSPIRVGAVEENLQQLREQKELANKELATIEKKQKDLSRRIQELGKGALELEAEIKKTNKEGELKELGRLNAELSLRLKVLKEEEIVLKQRKVQQTLKLAGYERRLRSIEKESTWTEQWN